MVPGSEPGHVASRRGGQWWGQGVHMAPPLSHTCTHTHTLRHRVTHRHTHAQTHTQKLTDTRCTHGDTGRHTHRNTSTQTHAPAGRASTCSGTVRGVSGAHRQDLSWSPPPAHTRRPVVLGTGRRWIECLGCEHRARKGCKRIPCFCGGRRLAGWEDHCPGQKPEGVGTGRRPPATWGRLRLPRTARGCDLGLAQLLAVPAP